VALSADIRLRCGVAAAVCVCLCGSVLAGCQTTQQTAARLKIRSARLLQDRKPAKVTEVAPGITVLGTSVVRDGKRTAIAVDLQNTGKVPLTDLPLSLELERGKKLIEVNGRPLSYYQAHTAAIGAGEKTTWVFAGKKPVPDGGELSARVGKPVDPPTTPTNETLLDVSGIKVTPSGSGATVTAEIHNPHEYPQYNVPVFAWARKGGRLVSAGQKTIEEVPTGGTESVSLDLIGDPGSTPVQVLAPATMFK